MYSLNNSYSNLIDWEKSHSKVLETVPLEYTCELKYDGASISITYETAINEWLLRRWFSREM
jgi:DNA ligase (NAD+)